MARDGDDLANCGTRLVERTTAVANTALDVWMVSGCQLLNGLLCAMAKVDRLVDNLEDAQLLLREAIVVRDRSRMCDENVSTEPMSGNHS